MKLKRNNQMSQKLFLLAIFFQIIYSCENSMTEPKALIITDDRNAEQRTIIIVFRGGETYMQTRTAPLKSFDPLKDGKWILLDQDKGTLLFQLLSGTESEAKPPFPPGGGSLISVDFLSSNGSNLDVRWYRRHEEITEKISDIKNFPTKGDASISLKRHLESLVELPNSIKMLIVGDSE